MADLGFNNKLLNGEDDENQQAQTGAATETPGQGESAGFVSGGTGGVSTAGTGAGGQGSWTNIQSYLSANKGGTGSEKLVQDKIGTQFGSEKSAIEKSGTDTKTEADKAVGGIKDAAQNGRKWVDDAAKSYDWSGQGSAAYQNGTQKLRDAVGGQYSGPSSYNYQMGGDTTRYGEALGNDQGFSNVMGELYRDASGGQISRGGLDLQAQLDASNTELANTRNNLLSQYAGLSDLRNQTAEKAQGYIDSARTDYGKYQNQLKDSLATYANDRSTSIDRAEDAARRAYHDQTYGAGSLTDKQFTDSLGGGDFDYLRNNKDSRGIDSIGKLQDFFDNAATWGGDAAKNAIFDYADANVGNFDPSEGNLARITREMDEYYDRSRKQFAGTADAEKRQFNTIMDILGLAGRETQGFDAVQRSKSARGK